MRIQIDLPYCNCVDKYAKMRSVQFIELTPYDQKIIDSFDSVERLNSFRLNLYNLFKTKVRVEFISTSEDVNWDIITKQWFRLSSDIIHLDPDDIWRCLPFPQNRDFFWWSKTLRKYISKENLYFFNQM